MRLATCRYGGQERVAIESGGRLGLLAADGPSLKQRLAIDPRCRSLEAAVVSVEHRDVEFLCPIPDAGKIICVGLNYRGHNAEAGAADPAYPSLFPRFADSQVGHQQPIVAPINSVQFDFEGELAVIIGKPAWRVAEANALDHVAGYSCFAENSVRDFQMHARQVTAGKNFRASGAFGPWLATADSVGDPASLELTTRLNGDVVQSDRVGNMIFSVAALIAYISSFTRLEPGDVIATGTPQGVGFTRDPPLWLRPGDLLSVEISRVGELTNPIIAELDRKPDANLFEAVK